MEDKHAFNNIDTTTFGELLKQYANIVPEKLAKLEEQRLHVIPEALKVRNPAFLTKSELGILMDWKLSHGKFRPALKSYIQKNSEENVQMISQDGISVYASGSEDRAEQTGSSNAIKRALAKLAELKGVGPATASLLLSTYALKHVPFFSDELFRWSLWEDGNGKGWDRKINYSVKEYEGLCIKVEAFMTRFRTEQGADASALDIEKVAYVLGKRSQGMPVEKHEGGETRMTGKKRKASAIRDDVQKKTAAVSTPASKTDQIMAPAEDTNEADERRSKRKLRSG